MPRNALVASCEVRNTLVHLCSLLSENNISLACSRVLLHIIKEKELYFAIREKNSQEG